MVKKDEKPEEVIASAAIDEDGVADIQSGPDVENPEFVEVPLDKMTNILDRLDKIESSNKEKDAIIAALEQSVSQTRLEEAKASMDVDKRPRVHFKKLDGKVVIGWKTERNEIIYNPQGQIVGEKLTATYYFPDGTDSGVMDQIRFIRATDQTFARVVEDEGSEALLEFEEKGISEVPLLIHKRFWNA